MPDQVSSIPTEALLDFGSGLARRGDAYELQRNQQAFDALEAPSDASIKAARDEAQLRAFAQTQARDLAFQVQTQMEMVPAHDYFGIGQVADTIISGTAAGLKPTAGEQRAQAYLNSTPQFRQIRQNLQMIMAKPAVTDITLYDENMQRITTEEAGLPTEQVKKYATPMTIPKYMSEASVDMYIARDAVMRAPASRRKERAEALGLVWDDTPGQQPRLLDHQESQDFRLREQQALALASSTGMSISDAKRQLASDDESRDRFHQQVELYRAQFPTMSYQMRAELVMQENARQAQVEKQLQSIFRVQDMIEREPRLLNADDPDMAKRLGMVAFAENSLDARNHQRLVEIDATEGVMTKKKQLGRLENEMQETDLAIVEWSERGKKMQMLDVQGMPFHSMLGASLANEIALKQQQLKEAPAVEKPVIAQDVLRLKQAQRLRAGFGDGPIVEALEGNYSGFADLMQEYKELPRPSQRIIRRAEARGVAQTYHLMPRPNQEMVRAFDKAFQEYQSAVERQTIHYDHTDGSLGMRGTFEVKLLSEGYKILDRLKRANDPETAERIGLRMQQIRQQSEIAIPDHKLDTASAFAEVTRLQERREELRKQIGTFKADGIRSLMSEEYDHARNPQVEAAAINQMGKVLASDNPQGAALFTPYLSAVDQNMANTIIQNFTRPQVPAAATSSQRNFTTPQEVQGAVDAGEISYGDVVLLNGQPTRVSED